MFKLRQHHQNAFESAFIRDFVERMLVHLSSFFPQQCAALGEEGVREAVSYGIDRARLYAIVTERDVCKYIDLMFTFGKNFDCDANLLWAKQVLERYADADPTYKVNILYDTALIHASGVQGGKA